MAITSSMAEPAKKATPVPAIDDVLHSIAPGSFTKVSTVGVLLGKSNTPRISLKNDFLPIKLPMSDAPEVNEKVITTTLPNGLRVVSVDSTSAVAQVGVFIKSGSRNEDSHNQGTTHFLEKMAFKSTKNRTDARFVRDMSRIAANIYCTSTRDSLVYGASVLRDFVPEALGAIADVIQHPSFESHEMAETADFYRSEVHKQVESPEVWIVEALHKAAFKNTGLGQSLYAHDLSHISREGLQKYAKTHFTPDNMVVSAVGVDHDVLVGLTQELFNNLPENHGNHKASTPEYFGGDVRQLFQLPSVERAVLRNGEEDPKGHTHFAIAFKSSSWNNPDVVAESVLATLLGGGGAFSAGGPGKGMYSRLSVKVVDRMPVESITSFNFIYQDAGLFGIHGTAKPENVKVLCKAIIAESKALAGSVTAAELTRAKNALKSSMLMAIEHRETQLDDLARQLITWGKVRSPQEFCELVDKVSAEDVQRVGQRMLQSKPSIAAFGEIDLMPDVAEVEKALKQ